MCRVALRRAPLLDETEQPNHHGQEHEERQPDALGAVADK